MTATVAQQPPAAPAPATTPGATTPPVTTPPAAATKPPSIATKAPTPTPAATTPAPAATTPSTPATTPTTPAGSSQGAGSGTKTPEPLLLDTNAASTYNPYEAPGPFGDPSLAIDGDTSTGWTAQVNPATAPKMAVGL